MFRHVAALSFSALLALGTVSQAAASDEIFFRQVSGQWSGPGEIVAGKYKGTKFVCNFSGANPNGQIGMSLDGGCRVGLFTQEMSANVKRTGKSYSGTFLDGAVGKGLDVVGGSIRNNQAVFNILRNKLKGAMSAQMVGKDKMNVTISVHVEDELVPVIGITLRKTNAHLARGN